MLAACSPSADQIWRVKSATDVLPLVPVMATITFGWRGKNFAAASASARRASATLMKATPSGSGLRGRARAPPRHRGPRPARQRGSHEAQSIILCARHRHEQVAGLDGAAVGADAGELERSKARVADGVRGEEIGKFHGARFIASMPPTFVPVPSSRPMNYTHAVDSTSKNRPSTHPARIGRGEPG